MHVPLFLLTNTARLHLFAAFLPLYISGPVLLEILELSQWNGASCLFFHLVRLPRDHSAQRTVAVWNVGHSDCSYQQTTGFLCHVHNQFFQ